MRKSNRSEKQVNLVETYCKSNMLWRTGAEDIMYTDTIELDLTSIEPTVAGPKRPQDKILLTNLKSEFISQLHESFGRKYEALSPEDFAKNYAEIFAGNEMWRNLEASEDKLYKEKILILTVQEEGMMK